MFASATSARPGGRTLAAYHRERALLYSVVTDLVDPKRAAPDPQRLRERLDTLRSTPHRARSVVVGVLADSRLLTERPRFSQLASLSMDLAPLEAAARRAQACARALEQGDLAFGAELWDGHAREMGAGAGRQLLDAADRLRALGTPCSNQLGRALRCLVEEDIVLAALGPST